MFLLRKWYLDCVTARGDVYIGYSARLRWDAVRVCYTSSLVAPAAGAVAEKATVLPVGAPAPSRRGLRWRCRRLGLVGAWHARAASIESVLLGDRAAEIEWACLQPAAAVRLHVGEAALAGLGYAERLTLALPPWQLPFHTLHWGRFVAPGASLVWIAWEGDGGGARFLYRDARPAELAQFAPDRLVAADGATLELAPERVLRSGPIVSQHLHALPCIAARVPDSFLAAREEKWLSHAVLECPGAAPVSGWAIHEIVRLC